MRSSKQAITVQVQGNALEQMGQVENAVAASFEYFDLVIEAFDKAAAVAVEKVVGNLIPPVR